MPGSGTRTFLEADHYEASLRQAQIEILIALSPKFKARLTWAELHDLQVLRCEEDSAGCLCLSGAAALLRDVSSAFRATAGMGRDGIAAGRDRVPRPRRAVAPVNAWLLRVERDSTGPGAVRTIWSGSFRKAFLFAFGEKNPASLPRAMWRACGACMRKFAASPRPSPNYWRIRRSRAPSSKV